MSDTVILGQAERTKPSAQTKLPVNQQSEQPAVEQLQTNLKEASRLVDDIVLKKYLYRLTELDIVPLDDRLKNISDIRLFRITEMVYQNREYATYKFASVFNAVQNLNCGVFLIADSDGEKTEFYMGVRSLDDKRTTKSLKDTLRNALCGQFPGVKTQDLLDSSAEEFLSNIAAKNIASISCVAKNKDDEFKDNENFIQGLEKLVLAMQGQSYTMVVLAKSTPAEQLEETRKAYETIYTQLSPFANMQLSYGTNTALSISDALSHGTTTGKSYSENTSTQKGTSHQKGSSESKSVSKPDTFATAAKTLGSVALGVASLATAPLTGGASIAAAAAITIGQAGLSSVIPKTYGSGTSTSTSDTVNESRTQSESYGTSESQSENKAHTEGITSGSSNQMQLTMQNKNLLDTMEKIELQLKRIDECESVGMWECAAYILSDTQETAEMAAGTYKALMKGEQSGIETSAINFWGRQKTKELPLLRAYLTNFIHPVFNYPSNTGRMAVTAASLVSGNELAIQMGLPRRSVCGFPVIEHADFGKEVVQYDRKVTGRTFTLGQVFSMGSKTNTEVRLDSDSLTMHTFVTGSTGSGKSNTVYEMLEQLHSLYRIPFLVVEPAKGEYKHIFGQFVDVAVYGTNLKVAQLLKINPFRFPKGVHVLEHLDRLVEIFNVCWPMYAAMPAILKEAMEKAYIAVGWNISTSENEKGDKYPNFVDLLEQIENVINDSKYSADSKGDYSGALLTRVRSLTNGLNGQIFCSDDLADSELFDKSVIVDLSRVGSTETKSLIMGLLVMKLNEYRMDSGKMNRSLSHITVLEEAHNLLKRTSTEQSTEGANLLGKSVELLANSIAEMRTYGEGFIIADQSPGLLDMSVIRNTNTKIILRLPDRTDRELVGYAAGLNDEQIEELAKLKQGVAAVYQNDWIEPVLVQIDKCEIEEKEYHFTPCEKPADLNVCRLQLMHFLIQGRVDEPLEFDVSEIEKGLGALGLSTENQEFVEELIEEYKETGSLELWQDGKFRRLSKIITDILESRNRIENSVLSAHDNQELTEELEKIVLQMFPDAQKDVVLTLSQCFMKDMSLQKDENEIRRGIYKNWIDSVREAW
ncbi:DUF87 domain-containing protein [Candidatus Merdisoma sp. JLR.KK006]|uniref:ATP-binding protein n=1 Tax=Candidatus Merdisoma sp. JLR.KK006 TaxID=3112626 RepID=UPI002FF1D24A